MGQYEVSRSKIVRSTPGRVHALIDDFHQWPVWSPWEDLDPELQRDYGGAPSGVGATYAWRGNRRAGQGTMEIVESSPERIEIALAFARPFRSTSTVVFTIRPEDDGTRVLWTMSGEQTGLMGLLGKVMSMDRFVGPDMQKGLDRLAAAAESGQ
jgi:hypothetical protein